MDAAVVRPRTDSPVFETKITPPPRNPTPIATA
jgi:hypothetical protein